MYCVVTGGERGELRRTSGEETAPSAGQTATPSPSKHPSSRSPSPEVDPVRRTATASPSDAPAVRSDHGDVFPHRPTGEYISTAYQYQIYHSLTHSDGSISNSDWFVKSCVIVVSGKNFSRYLDTKFSTELK